MRDILVTILLIIAVLFIYSNDIAGNNGTKQQVKNIGNHFNVVIQSIDP